MFTKRDLFKIILPMIIQQLLSITIGTADSMMVASAGEAAVSGVSLVGALDALLVIAFSSLVSGGAVTVSHALGSGDKVYTKECAKQLIYITTAIALFITVSVSIFRVPLLSWLYGSADSAVLENANEYFMVVCLSFPFLALEQSGVALFRVMGKTVVSMLLSLCMNLINIMGNAIFILVFDMGAAGAALSTLFARIVGSAVIILLLHNRKNDVCVERMLHYRPDKKVIGKILNIGVPHGIESSMFQFGRLATQVLISSMGTASIAANSVSNTLANYLYLPANAISNGAVTVVGRCIGAKNFKEAKKHADTLLWWTYLCMWAVSVITLLLMRPILSIYNLSEEGAQITFKITLFHLVSTSLIRPLAFTFPSVFKAAGDAKFSMAISTVSMWAIRVGTAFILSLDKIHIFSLTLPGANLGIMGVWIAMVADWVLRAVLFTIHYVRGKWMHAKFS